MYIRGKAGISVYKNYVNTFVLLFNKLYRKFKKGKKKYMILALVVINSGKKVIVNNYFNRRKL